MTSRFFVHALRPLALTLLTVTTLFTTHVDAQVIGIDPRLTGEDAAIPSHSFGSGPLHKVRIDRSDTTSLSQLLSLGAVQQVFDYESFVIAIVDEQAYGGREALRSSGLPFRDEMDLIALNGLLLDTRRPLETLARMAPEDLFGLPGSSFMDPLAGLYLVQFAAPVQDLWRNELEELGVEILQYMSMNAYVVQAGIDQVLALQNLVRNEMHVQYVGAYEPGFRMTPSVRRALEGDLQEPRSVTIQLIAGDDPRSSVQTVAGLVDEILGYKVVGPWVNVHAMVRPLVFREIASNPRVFQIEKRGVAVYHDEAQGQIVAGNLSGNSPSGPGYLSWLSSQGFTSSQFGSFSVNVVDDATSLTGHPDLASSRVAFSQNPTGQSGSQGGHGFLNAHIVSGLNTGTGSSAEDANGYNYGLGIAPWSQVGSTAIFGSGGLDPTSYESSAYGLGARISTNSWSFQSGGSPIADYDSNSQEFDFITRDAQSGTSGNQEYFVIFAAGNSGSGSNTVSTPSTAKNILTVGASENVRMTGTDGCAISNSGANSADDIIGFSSRGPVNSSGGDGRWKPEIVAPGTHIQAGVPQSSYNGSSVCNQYWPSGQTLYGWSSGTSHSTPAVAGGAALVYQWFLNEGMSAPSPAMLKATLVNGGEYMTGTGAGGSLPSNSQGMGRMQLTRTLDSAPRVMVDQTDLLTSTGATYSVSGTVQSSGVPFRVSLVWTDAPGPTSGAPWVNDLDLTVTVGGSTYLGNVFSGSTSVTGGSSDIRNNTESVFLPAGVSGSFTVTVEASSLAGDGVPGNGDSTDQDFALVIYNGSTGGGPTGPTANFSGTPTTGDAPLTVAFTDNSSAGVTAWDWSFGDGNTSTSQNPAHVYTAAGTYSVSLTATDADGSDTLTRTNYIVVSEPPPPPPQGVGDGSFEEQTAGSSPSAPWDIDFGTGHIINPAGGTSSDGDLPSEGSQWLEVSAASTNGATPPSNPGGVTSPSSGGAGVSTDFSYLSGETELSFDATFLRNESANSNYNDWMSIDVTDGSTTVNLFYADTTTATSGTSSKYGYAMTALSTVTNDLAALFPSSTTSTVFTLTVLVGNGTDAIQPSLGYADNFGLASGSTPTPPVANFSGTPTSGTTPLTVSFSDLSSNAPTSWSWTFGDGSSSSAQSPSHTYTTAGTYSVTLTATNADGSDSLTRSNYITVDPDTGGGGPLYYISFLTTTSVPGLGNVRDEDVVTYDSSTDTWALYFDGSDVGIGGTDINAMHVRDDGSILMSFNATSFDVPNLTGGPNGLTIEDSDLVLFTPTSTGASTSGTFSFFLDGSDIGLSNNGEDIDGVYEFSDGSLGISTLGSVFVAGPPKSRDEDVLVFDPSQTGSTTSGTWSLYFDGSDVGFSTNSGEDLSAISFDSNGDMLFSTQGSWSASGGAGDDEDVGRFTGNYGGATSGSASLVLDLSALGIIVNEDIDGLTYKP